MRCELAQCGECIVHHGNRIQLRLIRIGIDDAASAEGVQDERRDAACVKLLRPPSRGRGNPATAMDQNHRREFLGGASREAQLAAYDHWFSISITGEKLLV